MSFAVAVSIDVHEENYEEFVDHLLRNRDQSLELEDNCLSFDVFVPLEKTPASRIFLYEIYASEDDFEGHLKAPHYLDFDRQTAPWVRSKTVHRLNIVR